MTSDRESVPKSPRHNPGCDRESWAAERPSGLLSGPATLGQSAFLSGPLPSFHQKLGQLIWRWIYNNNLFSKQHHKMACWVSIKILLIKNFWIIFEGLILRSPSFPTLLWILLYIILWYHMMGILSSLNNSGAPRRGPPLGHWGEMGRTALPFSHVLESERERWKAFR